MPMYEFFCRECNRIYTFYSRTINTEKVAAVSEVQSVRPQTHDLPFCGEKAIGGKRR